eukprot:453775-Rhodomonas_salina.3
MPNFNQNEILQSIDQEQLTFAPSTGHIWLHRIPLLQVGAMWTLAQIEIFLHFHVLAVLHLHSKVSATQNLQF